jgi:hypothetical protein
VEGEDVAGPPELAPGKDDDDRLPRQPAETIASARRPSAVRAAPVKVTAQVTKVINEGDSDLHLVLSDSAGNTMIAEAPNSARNTGATPSARNKMAQARAVVTVCTKAEITGVAFFDFFHNQTGVAPNEIELHPILAFHCITP